MSAVETAIQKVKGLSEDEARELLAWLGDANRPHQETNKPKGAMAALGFARKFHPEPRTTDEWMKELREGEQ